MRSFVIGFLVLCAPVVAATFRQVPELLAPAVEAIEKVPEAAELLRQVEREGGVRLTAKGTSGFAAYWQGYNRTIVINTSYSRSLGRLISSLVFEMCNAAANQRLEQLWRQAGRRQISREEFVRGVERIEFENLQRSAAVLQAGRRRGILPADTRYWAPSDFESYLRSQRASGHSQFLASQYI